MKNEKKPDLVVFNEETQQYDAAIKPYGTSANSPVIKPLNMKQSFRLIKARVYKIVIKGDILT